jgi:hypothetical protein
MLALNAVHGRDWRWLELVDRSSSKRSRRAKTSSADLPLPAQAILGVRIAQAKPVERKAEKRVV